MTTRVPEKAVQASIVTLLETLGATVYVLGTVRRKGDYQGTMQTPGICDVIAFLPRVLPSPLALVGRPRTLLAIEVKAEKGRLSEPQKVFQQLCFDANVSYVTGNLDAVIAWLQGRGYLR